LFEPWLDDDGAAGLDARCGRAQTIGALVAAAWFQLGFLCGRRLIATLKELDRVTRHDGRYSVLVDELGVPVSSQQYAEIIEPGHNALEFNPVDQKNGKRDFVFADVIEKCVLKILRTLGCHGRVPFFCSRLARETVVAKAFHMQNSPLHAPLCPTQKRCKGQGALLDGRYYRGASQSPNPRLNICNNYSFQPRLRGI
jgi:hypothetical protein